MYTARHKVGATDLVCLGGVVMLAVAFHRQLKTWPEEEHRASALDVVKDACSRPLCSTSGEGDETAAGPSEEVLQVFAGGTRRGSAPSLRRVAGGAPDTGDRLLARVASDEAGVRERCQLASMSEDQTEAVLSRLHTLREEQEHQRAQDGGLHLIDFVGTWTDGIREFTVGLDGRVTWCKAARPVETFKCSLATLNPADPCLEFSLNFPPDEINPQGQATWHLGANGSLYYSFPEPLSPDESLTADGLSCKPLPFKRRQHHDWRGFY